MKSNEKSIPGSKQKEWTRKKIIDRKKLFRNMLIWGLAMTPIGAIVCWFLFTVLGIP